MRGPAATASFVEPTGSAWSACLVNLSRGQAGRQTQDMCMYTLLYLHVFSHYHRHDARRDIRIRDSP